MRDMSVKEFILKELEKNRDDFLSGEDLAQKANVTRAAVWKAMKELREEGYKIESKRKTGYRLLLDNDLLSPQGISSYLDPKLKEIKIFSYKTIDSTNEEGKRLINETQGPFLVVSEEQTKGKGRLGRPFYSPSQTGIYMSLVYPFQEDVEMALRLTTLTSVAVSKAIEKLTGITVGIKWVNDVYLQGKKIAGILTEGITSLESGRIETVIIGIGINIRTEEFPEEIRGTAASINIKNLIRNQLIAEIVNEFYRLLEDPSQYIDYYRDHHILQGKEVYYLYRGEKNYGKVLGVTDMGELILEQKGKKITISSGEVTIRPLD